MKRRFSIVFTLLCFACSSTQEGLVLPDATLPDAPVVFDATGTADARPPDASIDAGIVADARRDGPTPDACSAIIEKCNHADDNCNGQEDETFSDLGDPCVAGVGVCARSGLKECTTDGLGTKCSATPVSPGKELCANGLDDDCDGTSDEGFENIGAVCTVGMGACKASGAFMCSNDKLSLVCSATPGTPAAQELCGNNIDDDCDGATDEGFELFGMGCTGGMGACARPGFWVCSADRKMLVCNAIPAPPGPVELCGNNIDDDCDGLTEEGFETVGSDCDGDDTDLCKEGKFECSPNGLTIQCGDKTGSNVEICNGADDDCNPLTADGSQDPNLNDLCDSPNDVDTCLEGNKICRNGGLACTDAGDDNTTNDADNCGACLNACANPHGGRSCVSSNCKPSCDFGWQACDDPKLGCLSHRDTNPSCDGIYLGTIEGDDDGGGDADNQFTRSGYSEVVYKMTVQDVATCFHESVGVSITFVNPPNVRFGICSRCADCASGAQQCREPDAGAQTTFRIGSFDNCNGGDTHDQYVHIYFISGDVSSCNNWTLTIKGNQDSLSSSEETCGGDT